MSRDQLHVDDVRFVRSIMHPTDFSEASAEAFRHALAIALARRARFTVLHVVDDVETWPNFPSVRATLERWGLLAKGSHPEDVFEQLGVQVKKVGLKGGNPFNAIASYLSERPTDLIVLATERREGIARWVRPSVAERINRETRTMTLFVPNGAPGFVDAATGKVTLHKVVVPVDYEPSPLPAVEYAIRIARTVDTPVEIVLHHVKGKREMPAIETPDVPGITWKRVTTTGQPTEQILQVCEQEGPGLVVMTTAGHDGILDALRGSVTEQVLRKSRCPLLAVPSLLHDGWL